VTFAQILEALSSKTVKSFTAALKTCTNDASNDCGTTPLRFLSHPFERALN
jgi:hypothetical protein